MEVVDGYSALALAVDGRFIPTGFDESSRRPSRPRNCESFRPPSEHPSVHARQPAWTVTSARMPAFHAQSRTARSGCQEWLVPRQRGSRGARGLRVPSAIRRPHRARSGRPARDCEIAARPRTGRTVPRTTAEVEFPQAATVSFFVRRQGVHLLYLAALLPVARGLAAPALGDGAWLGLTDTSWFACASVSPSSIRSTSGSRGAPKSAGRCSPVCSAVRRA
jgi:hypothetical protein